jgi:hypothetical protein
MGTALSFYLDQNDGYSVRTEPDHNGVMADIGAYAISFGDSSTVQWRADQPIPGIPAFSDTMGPGEIMHKGESRVSDNNRYELILQPDGKLVLYAKLTDRFPLERPVPLWSSNTNGKNVDRVVMGRDGNLAMYPPPAPRQTCSQPIDLPIGPTEPGSTVTTVVCDSSIWQSRTTGHPGSRLKVEGDDNKGRVSIYDQQNELNWSRPSTDALHNLPQ